MNEEVEIKTRIFLAIEIKTNEEAQKFVDKLPEIDKFSILVTAECFFTEREFIREKKNG